ncbi:MAG: hypothetical protein Q7S28_00325 [bacterium]|nr:hypothetical protein [bacterium]
MGRNSSPGLDLSSILDLNRKKKWSLTYSDMRPLDLTLKALRVILGHDVDLLFVDGETMRQPKNDLDLVTTKIELAIHDPEDPYEPGNLYSPLIVKSIFGMFNRALGSLEIMFLGRTYTFHYYPYENVDQLVRIGNGVQD